MPQDEKRQEERRKILATVFLRGRQSRTNVIASNEVVNQALEALEKLEPRIDRSCGCVKCICEDEERCHGCGSHECQYHQDIRLERDKLKGFALNAEKAERCPERNPAMDRPEHTCGLNFYCHGCYNIGYGQGIMDSKLSTSGMEK